MANWYELQAALLTAAARDPAAVTTLTADDWTSGYLWPNREKQAHNFAQEERNSLLRSIDGTEQAPADTAAERAPQSALALVPLASCLLLAHQTSLQHGNTAVAGGSAGLVPVRLTGRAPAMLNDNLTLICFASGIKTYRVAYLAAGHSSCCTGPELKAWLTDSGARTGDSIALRRAGRMVLVKLVKTISMQAKQQVLVMPTASEHAGPVPAPASPPQPTASEHAMPVPAPASPPQPTASEHAMPVPAPASPPQPTASEHAVPVPAPASPPQMTTGELALAVLAPASPPQMTILGHLEPTDKLNLGATCITLHQASLMWFSDVTMRMWPAYDNIPALQAWLKRHQACLYLTSSAEQRPGIDSITVLPAAAVTSLTVHTYSAQPTAVSALTALTRLHLRGPCGNAQQRIAAQLLQPLTRLQHLSLHGIDLACSGQQLLCLPALSELTMTSCGLERFTPQTLARLTRVSLINNHTCGGPPLAALQRLEQLTLCGCSLMVVPEQLSLLTALHDVHLTVNKLQSGWQHLLPLTRLRNLNLSSCGLTAVPEQLSALTGLTSLNLSCNMLAGGWQHLLPLTQLRELNFVICGFTAVPEQVSALTALTHLALSHNSLTVVPQHLSALRNLACLSLCFNNISSGFQHLLPLAGLTRLTLSPKLLPYGEAPAALASLPHLQITYFGPTRATGDSEQAPADLTAERATGELALAVLAPAGPPQLTILGHLQQNDKLNLGATCTSLQQASLAWFPQVTVEAKQGRTDVALLAAWLRRHRGETPLLTVLSMLPDGGWAPQLNLILHQDFAANASKWAQSTVMALPVHLVCSLSASRDLPAAAFTLNALTSLSFRAGGFDCMPANLLRQLSKLRQLSMASVDLSSTAEELLALPALKDLQALGLPSCKLQAAPRSLSALTQLTALNLSFNSMSTLVPLTTLQRLQSLDLSHCSLAALPEELLALTSLTRIDLGQNWRLDGNWQHLLTLTQLQDLSLKQCNLTAVPQQLSELTALSRLDLSANSPLDSGWQHLQPLYLLQHLNLAHCNLTAVPEQLSALLALTSLNLYWNDELAGGWQHLLPLTHLQQLSLEGVPLPGGKPPPKLSALPQLLVVMGTKRSTAAHPARLEAPSTPPPIPLRLDPPSLPACECLERRNSSRHGGMSGGISRLSIVRKVLVWLYCGGAQQSFPAAADDRPLAVLAIAGPPQLTILSHLEQIDKLNLATTCTTLRQASLEWFCDVTVHSQPLDHRMQALEAWLKRHQACLYVTSSAEQRPRIKSIAALPATAVTSLTVLAYSAQPTALSALTAITSLELRGPCGNAQQRISAQLLQPLTRLQHLSLRQIDLACSGQQLLPLQSLTALQALEVHTCRTILLPDALLAQLTALDLHNSVVCANAPWAALQRLTDLGLWDCYLVAVPEQLSALTALTRLTLFANAKMAGGWQHLLPLTQLISVNLAFNPISAKARMTLASLQRLQNLNIGYCSLMAVPEQLSALTALTGLKLSANTKMSGGWQHLLPLTQLQDLDMHSCDLTAVPQELSKLTALTRLDLSYNRELAGGWQRLLPLTQLRDLNLNRCGVTAVPEHLSALRNLAYLSLGFNNVSSGFQHLLPLTGLTHLILSRAPVPAELAALPRLRISYLTILGHLKFLDKLDLSATCTSLRQASLAWFPEVYVTLRPDQTDVTSLAAWLERHQDVDFKHAAFEAQWNDSLMALPSSLIISLAAHSYYGPLAAVSTLTALTRLELKPTADEDSDWNGEEDDDVPINISVHHLRPLTRLRQLSLVDRDMSGAAEELLSLPALARLQALKLRGCTLTQLPRALTALTQLTALDLSCNRISAVAPLTTLQRLQSLDLSYCSLTAVPKQLSALTRLTSLDLNSNDAIDGGWQHLACLGQLCSLNLGSLPAVPRQLSMLTQLQDLDLEFCSCTAVPEQLLTLTALTRLKLSHNSRLDGGWQHLLPLTQLRDLSLSSCCLTAVPAQLSALPILTRLDLSKSMWLSDGLQHLQGLTQLQNLDLSDCSLTAVPAQVSALTALTRLKLYDNRCLDGSWQHLLPLTQLRDLDLAVCGLKSVPEQLSVLTDLTRLVLSVNVDLVGGWQHLLPLQCLRKLDLCELLVQQLAILGHLEQSDKLNLGAACTSLQQASLAWFPKVTVEMKRGKTDVAFLAAWLERHQACLHLLSDDQYDFEYEMPEAEWADILTALPTSLLTSLSLHSSFRLPAVISTLTALTQLSFETAEVDDEGCSEQGDGQLVSLTAHLLRPLTRLRQLGLPCGDKDSAEELLALPALKDLQALRLYWAESKQLPRALSALTQLTALDLSSNLISDAASLSALQRLQSLDLSLCSLTAVPEQVSALTALTRLNLSANTKMAGGWQHLLPLTQLQHLELFGCGLTVLPKQLSGLMALTRLDMHGNRELAGGWQHLLPLTQLQDLNLRLCGLTAVPEQVSALTAFTRLTLSDNEQLAGGWQHLMHLGQLCDLDLSYCNLAAVPQQLSVLTALTRLDLSSNEQLDGGWQHLLPLTRLQHLALMTCGLRAVPEQVSALTALTSLSLWSNWQLAGGWQHLMHLGQLRVLDLSYCNLAAVPQQLSTLTALTGLNLAGNSLRGGWQHLLPLTQLRRLHVQDVPGWTPPPELAAIPQLRTAGELALAVLAAPGPPQLAVICHLELTDRLNLGATCTSLRQASLEWLSEVTAHSQPWEDTMPAVEAWLKRYQACLYVTAIDTDSSKGFRPRIASITALPAALVTWLTVYTYSVLPADVSTLTALDWLNLRGPCTNSYQQISAQLLQPLTKLRVLCMRRIDLACGQQLLSLPALRGLQAWEMDCGVLQRLTPGTLAQLTGLTLFRSRITATAPLAALQRVGTMSLCSCSLTAVPEELSALTALTWLDLSDNRQLVGGWQHLAPLIRLRRLELFGCRSAAERQQALGLPALTYLGLSYNGLVALPQQVSALTALVSLDLAGNSELDGGWQHLQPLTQLRDLDLFGCNLAAVPEQLTALAALTELDLTGHKQLAGGWQHLLQLRALNLSHCGLTALHEQLSLLTALTRLDLSYNYELAGGRQHLLPLTQLRHLRVDRRLFPLKQMRKRRNLRICCY
ncbi:LRR receptor-like serine/threonine-protein kinase GSO1 [Chlorella vulgaris]